MNLDGFPIGCDPRDFPADAEAESTCPGCRGVGCRDCTWSGFLTPEQIRQRRTDRRYWQTTDKRTQR